MTLCTLVEDDDLNEAAEDDADGDIPESEQPSVIHKIGHDFGDWLELRKKTILRSGNLIKNKIDSGSLVGGKQNRINRVGY